TLARLAARAARRLRVADGERARVERAEVHAYTVLRWSREGDRSIQIALAAGRRAGVEVAIRDRAGHQVGVVDRLAVVTDAGPAGIEIAAGLADERDLRGHLCRQHARTGVAGAIRLAETRAGGVARPVALFRALLDVVAARRRWRAAVALGG